MRWITRTDMRRNTLRYCALRELPIYPGMPLEHIERVCEVLLQAVRT